MEKEIEFMIDGQLCGSATLFIENGEVDTTNAEDKFWKAVRFNKQDLIAEELEYIIDHLTSEQEDKLEAHWAEHIAEGVLDDDMEDAFSSWLEYATLDEVKDILFTKKVEVKHE